MSSMALRGVVQGGMVILREKPSPLSEGTEVFITPLADTLGSPAAVLAAVESSPQVPAAWVDELETLIAHGRRAPMRNGLFADDADTQVKN